MATAQTHLTPRQRFDSLTGMRALAAVSVAIHHTIGVFPSVLFFTAIGRWGYLGVDFFFCLSGFVMQWAWSRGTTSRDFLARRFSRIYPLIVVCLAVSLLSWAVLHTPLAGYVGPPRSVLYNLLLIQSWFFSEPTIRQSWDGVTWSLSCEMFFYACSPFILARIARLRARPSCILLCSIFLLFVIAQLAFVPHAGETGQNLLYFFPPARLPEFIMGALACQTLISGYRLSIRNVWLVFGVTAVGPLVAFSNIVPPAHQYLSMTSLVVIPGFILTILVGASRDTRPKRTKRIRLLASRQMVWLGDVSYSYYMVHALVLGGLALALSHFGLTTTSAWIGSIIVVGFLILSLLVAWFAWRVIERPGQRALFKLLRDRQPQPSHIEPTFSSEPS